MLLILACGKPATNDNHKPEIEWNPGHYLLAMDKTTQQDFLKGNFLGVQKKIFMERPGES